MCSEMTCGTRFSHSLPPHKEVVPQGHGPAGEQKLTRRRGRCPLLLISESATFSRKRTTFSVVTTVQFTDLLGRKHEKSGQVYSAGEDKRSDDLYSEATSEPVCVLGWGVVTASLRPVLVNKSFIG